MIKGRDFIFTGLQPWDITIGSNAKDIALEMSKHNRVLYINAPLDKKTYFTSVENTPDFIHRKKVVKKQVDILRKVNENLWLLDFPFTVFPVNFLPDNFLFDFLNYLNNRKIYKYVNKIVKDLSFKDPILFMDNDIYRSFYAKDILKPELSVYYRRDNMFNDYWNRHAPRLEPLLCTKSDLVITNSNQLAEAVKSYNPNTHDVGQGVDLSAYKFDQSYPIHSDIKDIPHPIIGYVGWITSLRLDANLLYNIAIQCPDYSFVMVGEEDDFFKKHKLHSLKNVTFLGHKKISETIDYIATFDVCMNPQLINHFTIGNYPRKIDEYLAMGKPTVATNTDTMRDIFSEYVFLADNSNDYIKHISQAILETNDMELSHKRIAFAHSHSWENCVERIYDRIESTLRL